MKTVASLSLSLLCVLAFGCFNEGRRVTAVSSSRFELETGSVVLGAKQLLVDTANGDVWILEGGRAPDAKWVLLARGPEDARELELQSQLPAWAQPAPPNDRDEEGED
jgi:hypothetical protein